MIAAATPLVAVEIRRLPSQDAHQGVAAGAGAVFAIANRSISRLDPTSGRVLARWQGDPARFKHLNSCIVRRMQLICASSNYPDVPMLSRIETFDARTLRHLGTRAIAGPGSLTWLDYHGGAWWACYANYDGKGGAPGRDHRATAVLRYDRAFREIGRYALPSAVLNRMAPRSASGGVWGRDGLLYVTGHDRPELYALRVPVAGNTMRLVATVMTPTDGQAIGWGRNGQNHMWSIDRELMALVESRLPRMR